MGEKQMKRFLTLKEIGELYGFRGRYMYNITHLLRPALMMIGNIAPRPYRYDAEMLNEIIRTKAKPKEQRKIPLRLQKKRKQLEKIPDDGESWR